MANKVGLIPLAQKILTETYDINTGCSEVILIGYSEAETVSEHISRYIEVSKIVRGVVLDCASGSCYGSSILKRSKNITFVISVDLNIDLLRYGKTVYDIDCVCADAMHLPFRRGSFDSVVSIETIEHLGNVSYFLANINFCLKRGGKLVLSTPNKLYSSPFVLRPLNPYHKEEYYLGQLLSLLRNNGFKIHEIYGGRKVKRIELVRRILGSLLKYCLARIIKTRTIDAAYNLLISKLLPFKHTQTKLIDPNPQLITHEKLKISSNLVLYQYFIIISSKS